MVVEFDGSKTSELLFGGTFWVVCIDEIVELTSGPVVRVGDSTIVGFSRLIEAAFVVLMGCVSRLSAFCLVDLSLETVFSMSSFDSWSLMAFTSSSSSMESILSTDDLDAWFLLTCGVSKESFAWVVSDWTIFVVFSTRLSCIWAISFWSLLLFAVLIKILSGEFVVKPEAKICVSFLLMQQNTS